MTNFHNPNSRNREYVQIFHDYVIAFLAPIFWGVFFITVSATNAYSDRTLTELQELEFIWTATPILMVLLIVIPSVRLLYLEDSGKGNVKRLGIQWFWQYDYPSLPVYSSYLIKSVYRLLDSDHRLHLTLDSINLYITSVDVLHSWTVPALCVKADAVPGRINKTVLSPKRAGVFFGQCREICGSNHTFIPIAVECTFNFIITLKVRDRQLRFGKNFAMESQQLDLITALH